MLRERLASVTTTAYPGGLDTRERLWIPITPSLLAEVSRWNEGAVPGFIKSPQVQPQTGPSTVHSACHPGTAKTMFRSKTDARSSSRLSLGGPSSLTETGRTRSRSVWRSQLVGTVWSDPARRSRHNQKMQTRPRVTASIVRPNLS
jgi:hypothetical protein